LRRCSAIDAASSALLLLLLPSHLQQHQPVFWPDACGALHMLVHVVAIRDI
jgi:hypothetical protein